MARVTQTSGAFSLTAVGWVIVTVLVGRTEQGTTVSDRPPSVLVTDAGYRERPAS